MAKQSLTGIKDVNNSHHPRSQFLYQNAALLVDLFTASYQDYAEKGLAAQHIFVDFLNVFVETIENSCLQTVNVSRDYSLHRKLFHYVFLHQTWQREEAVAPFLNAVAYLTKYGVESFRDRGYPESYGLFLHQLEMLLDNQGIIESGKHDSVALLLAELRQKPGL